MIRHEAYKSEGKSKTLDAAEKAGVSEQLFIIIVKTLQ